MLGRGLTDQISLEELKAEGARNSSYLNKGDKLVTTEKPAFDSVFFQKQIKPIFDQHCVQCHGPDKAKAKLRIDQLDPNLFEGSDVDWWVEILGVMGNAEMPPPEDSELSAKDRDQVMTWLSDQIRVASMTRKASQDHSSFRRMTRYEFNYALQDLLGLERNFARDLPPEAHSEDGFENSSEVLQMSVSQLETYRDLARKALMRATVHGPRPKTRHWSVSMKEVGKVDWAKQEDQLRNLRKKFEGDPANQAEEVKQFIERHSRPHRGTYFKDLSTGRTAVQTWNYRRAIHAIKPSDSPTEVSASLDHVAIIPQGRGQHLLVELGNNVPDEGILRVRARAARTSMEDERVPSLQLEFGWQASNEGRSRQTVSKVDVQVTAPPDKPEFYEWDVPVGDIYPRNSVRKTSPMGVTPSPSEYIRLVNSSASHGDIKIDYVEISTPAFDAWPPRSHQKIFFESKNKNDESLYAGEIIAAFMKRALRRGVSDEEVSRKVRLFHTMRKVSDTFEEAVVEVLAAVLASPDFLYLVQGDAGKGAKDPERLSDDELATRLSIFLWSSVPDAQLLDLAHQGKLSQPEVLTKQVQRMLADPRAKRFSKHFVHQWLDMQLLDFLKVKRSFSPLLKEAMKHEPIKMFEEVLAQNESVLDFIHAEYAMVNERLAQHYGLKNVYGNHFRRVLLTPDHHRGGLITQAGLLAMNSSGEDSNPLKRGIWLLESLLNDPPPPPPPTVPEIDLADPRIAKMTLKERIEDHRNHEACMSCHVKIDPWGIALENYDALGRWRNTVKGKPVDASSLLFNDEPLNGIDGLKRFLLKNRQDQFVQSIVHKMVVYSLGRPLSFADRADVEKITAKVRQKGDGLGTLVTEVVTSELFQSK